MKTNELTGAALDWAVARAIGEVSDDIDDFCLSVKGEFDYSTDWALAGPLLVQHDIIFRKYHRPDSPEHGKFYAKVSRESGTMIVWSRKDSTGPTPLIAAMRCLVAAKLGPTVDIPDELLES